MREVPGPACVRSCLHDAQYFLAIAFPLLLSYLKDCKGALLFIQRRESAAKLINADCFVFLFCFCRFFVCRFVVDKCCFCRLCLKENKRATWRSLIRAKGRNLWRN